MASQYACIHSRPLSHLHSHPHHKLPDTSFILMVKETGSCKFPNLLPQMSPSMVPHPFRGLAFALAGAGLGQNSLWALTQPQALLASGVTSLLIHPGVTGDVSFGCCGHIRGEEPPWASPGSHGQWPVGRAQPPLSSWVNFFSAPKHCAHCGLPEISFSSKLIQILHFQKISFRMPLCLKKKKNNFLGFPWWSSG